MIVKGLLVWHISIVIRKFLSCVEVKYKTFKFILIRAKHKDLDIKLSACSSTIVFFSFSPLKYRKQKNEKETIVNYN